MLQTIVRRRRCHYCHENPCVGIGRCTSIRNITGRKFNKPKRRLTRDWAYPIPALNRIERPVLLVAENPTVEGGHDENR